MMVRDPMSRQVCFSLQDRNGVAINTVDGGIGIGCFVQVCVTTLLRRSLSSRHVVLQPSPPARSPQLRLLSRQLQRPCRQMQQQSLQESCVSSPCRWGHYMFRNCHSIRWISKMSIAGRVRVGVGSNSREIEVCNNQEEESAGDENVVVIL